MMSETRAQDATSYAELAERYKASPHFEKIQISDRAWDLAIRKDPAIRQTQGKQEFLASVLGVPFYELRHRESLRHAPESLIKYVEEGLAMGSAVLMLREARQLSVAKRMTLNDAMDAIIATYSSGTVRRTGDAEGTWFWVKPTLAKAAANGKVKKAEESDTVRAHWVTIRQALAQIVLKKGGAEIDALSLEEANEWFEKELTRVIDGFTNRIRKRKRNDTPEVNRVQYVNACKVLGIVPSEIGDEIDIEVAKAAKKSLVRRYHPDTTTEPEDKEKYQLVIEAFDTVDAYCQQMNRIARNQQIQLKTKRGE